MDVAGEIPVRTHKSEALAQFREALGEQAEFVYRDLCNALLSGEIAFDMTDCSEN